MIRYDRTAFTVVIYCDCGWSDVGISKTAAWSLAADHETRAHPGDYAIRRAEHMRKIRASSHDEM